MKVGVRAGDEAHAAAAAALARRLGLPLNEPVVDAELILDASGLSLHSRAAELAELGAPLQVDFLGGRFGYRLQHGGGRGQRLARAVGLRKGAPPPAVLDATAGMGRDAFLLAWLGCPVIGLERDPVVYALLEDGLRRALEAPATAERLGGRLRFVFADAADWLADCRAGAAATPDVVLLDPMHPDRGKSALVKREMRWFRALVGDDADSGDLLAPALAAARRRVVVKRPLHAAPLGPDLSFSARGRSTRFDVHLKAPGTPSPADPA